MIEEDYVSVEVAKLLKEKGFDGKCYNVWVHYTSSTPKLWAAPNFVEGETIVDRESVESAERVWNMIYGDSENKYHGYLAPTLQMVRKWLIENYNIHIEVRYFPMPDIYRYVIIHSPATFENIDSHPQYFNKDEEACEAAIKYCLENLI